MASIPVKPTPESQPAETTEQRFRRLEESWEADTAYLSSVTDIVGHPAFQQIIGMGEAVIPFMLHDLAQAPTFWVWALPTITGEDPVPAADRGNLARMSEAWLRWAQGRRV